MREFFRGWRRKVGFITMLLACVLMIGWMRSRITLDTVSVPILNRLHVFASVRGEFAWLSVDWLGHEVPQWKTNNVTEITISPWSADVTLTDVMERLHRSLEVDAKMRGEKNGRSPRLWMMSYRSAILILTLLSAFLILWKPTESPK